jgi:hypothetical protein
MPQVAAAEPDEQQTKLEIADDQACLSYAQMVYDPAFPDFVYPDEPTGEPNSFRQMIDVTYIKSLSLPAEKVERVTSRDYINSVIGYFGPVGMTYYKTPATTKDGINQDRELVLVCNTAVQDIPSNVFNPLTPLSPETFETVDLIQDPFQKIAFVNPVDKYALLGETCQGGLIKKPTSEWSDSENPCPGFNSADDIFRNGKWDAPKVDRRVLETLLYLVTPIEQGGAGREFIRVKKLIQYDTSNPLTQPVVLPTPEVSPDPQEEAEEFDKILDQSFDEAAPSTEDEEATAFPSSYYINLDDPPHLPRVLSSSVMIDQIDKLRVSTKIEQKRLFGNNTVEYKVQSPTPIDVSWQSDAGLAKDPPPDFSKLSMLESSRFLTNAAIVELLNDYGLGDLEINVADTEFNNLGDVALVVGESLLEQLLGSPRGSLKGYNLLSTLQSIGLSYLEQNLGLVPGSLADVNPLDRVDETADFSDLTRSVGRSTLEYVLGFPRGSLRTETGSSNELLESVGRRYLEKQVFQVSEGTLLPSPGYPLKTVGDLLARLGEGRIEHVFKLPKQSLRKPTYDNASTDKSFRQSSFKASLLFQKLDGVTLNETSYDMADYISGKLNLAFVPYTEVDDKGNLVGDATRNMYGFTERDFNFPSLNISTFDEGSLTKFKKLVGSRTIETSLGIFRREGSNQSFSIGDSALAPVSELKIGGITYNARFRPLNEVGDCSGTSCVGDNGRTSSVNWCSNDALSYVREGSESRWVARPAEGDTIGTPKNPATAANIRKTIEELQKGWGTLNKNLNWSGHSCETDESFEWSDPFLGQIKSVVLSTLPVNQTVFLNQDKAPKRENFFNDGGTRPGEDSPQARYNTATLLYYNLPENHKEVPINTVATKAFATEANQTVDPDEVGTPPKTVAEILKTLTEGGKGGKDFTWKADSSLAARISMLDSLLQRQLSERTFDLAGILSQNLPANQLDQLLLDRLNLLTSSPITKQNSPNLAKFEEQYNDPAYNGWLFLLKDLRQRLDCKTTNGYYKVREGGGGMECSPQPNEPQPGEDALYEIQEAKRVLDRLYKQPWTLVQSIVKSLETRTYSDPSGFTNQSAMAAAISLSSVKFQVDENYRFKPQTVYSTDIVRNLVSPGGKGIVSHTASIEGFFTRDSSGKSLLGRSGIEYAAEKFTTDALAQATFAAQLKTDFAEVINLQEDVVNLFELAEKDAESYGFDYTSLVEKGLANDDFIRIFLLDQANQVFDRVGKEQTLRVLWRKSGAAAKIKSSEQYQSILRNARRSIEQLTFYTDRLRTIKQLSREVGEQAEGLGNTFTLLGKQLKTINSKTADSGLDSIEEVQDLTRRYEPTLNKLNQLIQEGGRNLGDMAYKTYEIIHLSQEIVAGRQLPRDERVFVGYAALNQALEAGDSGRAGDGCFDKQTLLRSLTGRGEFSQRMFDFAVEVGTCRLETGLGLPVQSVFMWYKLGTEQFPPTRADQSIYPEVIDPDTGLPLSENAFSINPDSVSGSNRDRFFEVQPDGKLKPLVPTWNKNRWSADNFAITVGIADRIQRDRDTIDPAQVSGWLASQDAATVNDLLERGREVLAATALAKLAQMIPGFGRILDRFQLTTQDLAAIFQGNMQPLLGKIGGSFIDTAFDLPDGSGYQLIYPDCRTNDGNRAPCNKDPNHPETDPDNVRIRIIAEAGLRKLGLVMPRIPEYFSFTAGGNLAENWGNAVLSNNLNLAPNSFRGKMVGQTYQNTALVDECIKNGIRCLNRAKNLARSFGFTTTPYARSLEEISNDILNAASELEYIDGGSISVSATFNLERVLESYYATTTLERASSTQAVANKSGYWTNLSDSTAQANAKNLAESDLTPYTNAINELWNAFNGSVFSNEVRSDIRAIILRNLAEEVGPGREVIEDLLTEEFIANLGQTNELPVTLRDPSATYQELYLNYIRTFQKRLVQLNTTYNLERETFEKFVQGAIEASDITKRVGLAETAGSVLGEYLDRWITDNGPVWMRELNEAFKLVTAEKCTDGGSDGVGLGTFLTQTVSGSGGCLENLGLFSTKDLFYGTSDNMKRLRVLLFEKFLGGIFSSDLERQVGFRPGAFLRMVEDPKNARQILATEGVLMVADRVFGAQNKSDACTAKTIPDSKCTQDALQSIVKEAFIAGFCETDREDGCDFTFSTERSLDTFNEKVGEAVDNQLRRIGREYLGVEITRQDLQIHNGDMRGIALIGIQAVANSLNNALYKGDPDSPMAKFFTTYYQEIKISLGYDEPQAWVLDMYKIKGGIDEMYNYTCGGERINTNPACSDNKVTFDEYVDTIAREENWDQATASQIAKTRMKVSGDEAATNYAQTRRSQALASIQYAMLDIVAFSKDRAIPPNFSKRLLSGSGTDRANALGEYLIGSVMDDDSSLGQFMRTVCSGQQTGTECFNLFKDFYRAIKGGSQSMQTFFNSTSGSNFINLLDIGVSDWFKNELGISLPEGTFEGIYVWGMRGFKAEDFNKEGFCDGVSLAQKEASGGTCSGPIGIPVGRILQDFGEAALTDWGDKTFGFERGTTAKIVRVAELIVDKQKLSKLAVERGWTKEQLAAARTKNAVAIAQLISEVVVSIFEKELGEFDKSLGLPPGTSSIIIGAAVTYGVSLALGVSGSAATAAAFGPAFFVALGFNLIFGVTRVVITNRATGDGYYPFYSDINQLGSGEATRCIGSSAGMLGGCKAEQPYHQVLVHDPSTGEFDPTFIPTYRAGLKEATRGKVKGLLTDLLLMPGSSYMERAGLRPENMRVSQVFTYGGIGSEYDPTTTPVITDLLNRGLPQDGDFPDWGYGSPDSRCENITESEDGKTNICTRKPGWLIGFYGIPNLTGAIHIRW